MPLMSFQFHFSTIKNRQPDNRNRKSVISIPFSTIKSALIYREKSKTYMFQFHLVRLKATVIIKSFCSSFVFQFHLVRLKDTLKARTQN